MSRWNRDAENEPSVTPFGVACVEPAGGVHAVKIGGILSLERLQVHPSRKFWFNKATIHPQMRVMKWHNRHIVPAIY